jgi:hypothetical protein
MAVRPIVDGIEREHEGRLEIIRINVLEPGYQPLLDAYNFQVTPTFVFFDPGGEERWRSVGAIDPLEVDRTLAEME